ncbi:MAG TPA: 23S rRNA (adenine(2503)-C(2))-methyltransferase RlmN [Gemmataceae bacterium]|jgi:23S rRNA (adenine2503-C2)-methyltransferase|nr:23S rRNA (adenine(2503)-C(2))-methyltransferase RlmN [Gemmataceae bacterium]
MIRAVVPLNTDAACKLAVLDQSADAVRAWLAAHDQPAWREKQIRRWIVANRAESFEQMSDLPKDLRPELAKAFSPLGTVVVRHLLAKDSTHKLLLRLNDQRHIECVLIQEDERRTACISTQVGCGMGCVFCASGLNGVDRNLTAGEILEQLVRLRNLLPAEERLTHIVVMGMGEPLANLDGLLQALEVAGQKDGLNIGARHITISTVGLPKKIRQLADGGRQYHLAVSLHAPNDALRNQIVPTNESIGLAEILSAADYFFDKTGRQVTFEYVLLGGMNDGTMQARELASLLRNRKAHVNLIPFNEVEGLPYRLPAPEALAAFIDRLQREGISVKVRKRKGSDIDAACGQLRRQVEADLDRNPPRPEGLNSAVAEHT